MTIQDLLEGTEYTFTAQSRLGDQLSAAATAKFTTKFKPPINARPAHIEPTKVVLVWDDPRDAKNSASNNNNPLTSKSTSLYRILCSCSQGGVEYTTKYKKFTISNLAPGSDYTVQVLAADEDLQQWSKPAIIEFTTPLAKPEGLRLLKKDNSKVSITWRPQLFSNEHGKVFYRVTLKLTDVRYQRHRIILTKDIQSNSRTFHFTNLRSNTVYQIEVQVKVEGKKELDSARASITVKTTA